MATTQTYPCPRCNGRKHMAEFANVANGICFKCRGTGITNTKPHKKVVQPLSAYQARLLAIVTEGDLSAMSYKELYALRDFAHWPMPQCPTLLTIWRDRGEAYFQAAQSDKLAALYATA